MKEEIGKKIIIEQYGHLYEKYAPYLLFYARKFVPRQTAEDIVHDIFLNMWKNNNKPLINEYVVSYMFQSVQNGCINYLKHETIQNEYINKAILELKLEELTLNPVEKRIIDQEQLNAIYRSIDQLPDKNKEVFQLSYIQGKSNTEISELLNISIRTVENHLYKALQELRKRLLFIPFFLL